jgi:RNA polymerase sigma-70 factor, ECF subfamily
VNQSGPTLPPFSPAEVEAAAQRARATWPGVAIAPEAFVAHLQACGADAEGLSHNGADLYLAAACALGVPAALRWFDRRVLPGVDGALFRLGLAEAWRDELRQQLRVTLLTGERTIARYSGRSPLLAWLRTVVQRTATRQRRLLLSEERQMERYSLDHILVAHPDPEVAAMKHRHGAEFQRALDDSLGALSDRSKEILRLYYVGGSNIDAIAAREGVHRATVARWLHGIRAVVISNLRARLAAAFRPTSSAFRTLMTAMRDEVDLDIGRLLEAPPVATRTR